MNISKYIEDNKDIFFEFNKERLLLTGYFKKFWSDLYEKDNLIFVKESILFYKNIQNQTFHDFFSGFISKVLYTKKCSKQINKYYFGKNTDNKTLCKTAINVITFMDEGILMAPSLSDTLTVYRAISGNKALIKKLKKKRVTFENHLSTSISPFFIYDRMRYESEVETPIIFTIILPKKTRGYYMNIPFLWKENNTIDYYNEFEYVIARDSTFYINKVKKIKNIIFVEMLLVEQQFSTIKYDFVNDETKLSDIRTEMSIHKKDYKKYLHKDTKYKQMIKIFQCFPFPAFKYDKKVNSEIFYKRRNAFKYNDFKNMRNALLKNYDLFIKKYKKKVVSVFGEDIYKEDLMDFFIYSLDYNNHIKKKIKKVYFYIHNKNDYMYKIVTNKKKLDHMISTLVCPLSIFQNIGVMASETKYKECIIAEIDISTYKHNYIIVNKNIVLFINKVNFKNIKIKNISVSQDIKFTIINCDMY